MNHSMSKVHKITLTAVLMAIVFLLSFTPLGYLVVGPIAATTVQMPVIIGAVLMGPACGAILGAAFGLSALVKVLTMPGADPVATIILTNTPLRYLIICVFSRVVMGALTGLLAKWLRKIPALWGRRTVLAYGVTGFAGSFLNTIFYLGLLGLLATRVVAEGYGVDISGVAALVVTTAVSLGIPEAVVSCIVVAAVCRALEAVIRRGGQ